MLFYKKSYEMMQSSNYQPENHQILGYQTKDMKVESSTSVNEQKIQQNAKILFPYLNSIDQQKIRTRKIRLDTQLRQQLFVPLNIKNQPQRISALSNHIELTEKIKTAKSPYRYPLESQSVRNKGSRLENKSIESKLFTIKSPFLVPVVNGLGLPSYSNNASKFVKKTILQGTLKRRKSDNNLNTQEKQLILETITMQSQKGQRASNNSLDQNAKTQDITSSIVDGGDLMSQISKTQCQIYTGSIGEEIKQIFKGRQKRFILQLAYPDLRDCLIRRGWIEDTNKQSLDFDLKFTLNSQDIIFSALAKHQIINHNRGEGSMTCKTMLIECLQEAPLYWITWLLNEYEKPIISKQSKQLSISGISQGIDAFYPKSFILTQGKDFIEFQQYFWIIHCESYLREFTKLFDSPEYDDKNFIKEKLIVCLSIIKRKSLSIDDIIESGKETYKTFTISNEELSFLSKEAYPESYIKYIKNEDWYVQELKNLPEVKNQKKLKSKDSKLQAYDIIKYLSKQYLTILDPKQIQKNINGTQNLWIAKPGGLSRGRNIKLFNIFNDIIAYTNASSDKHASETQQQFQIQRETISSTFGNPKTWVVQKYIENPLLILNRKFDIRVWVLIASWNPLQIYLYHECYIRFSATDYNPKNVKNMFIHLTNNSISKNCSSSQQSDYFSENMWSLDNLKTFLSQKYHREDVWQSNLLPQLKDIVRLSVLSAWEKVDWRENSCGLYGFDVIIDDTLKMWLLEINLCPTMEHSTKVTSYLVPKMTEDMIKVMVDKKESIQADTGQFEMIFESPKINDKPDFRNKNQIQIQGIRIQK